MSRITKETQKQLANLLLKIKLRQQIPDFLFLNPTRKDISLKLGFTKKTRKLVWYLKSKELIVINNGKYQLTIFGKFAYLMYKFKVSFIELCFLLETYYCEKRMRQYCCDGFYTKYSFYNRVEDIVPYGTLSNTIVSLSKKNLIYRHHKASYSVMPEIFKDITKYREIVDEFHDWFIDMCRRKNELILLDPLIIQRQKEYSDLYHKMILR